jgi:hypothetical protein
LKYAFLNGDRSTPVIISDKLSESETQKLVATCHIPKFLFWNVNHFS